MKVLRFISVVFILLWGLAFFVGFNYAQSGEYLVSIIATIIALLFMGGAFYYMLRTNEKPIEALGVKGTQTFKGVMIATYAAVSLFMAVYINHMGVVSFTDKTEIQDKAKTEIQELRATFDNGESPASNSYRKWVEEQLDVYKIQLENKREQSISDKINKQFDELTIDSGFESLREEVDTRLTQIYRSVDTWNPFTVVHELKILDNNKKDWEAKVEDCARSASEISDEIFRCTSEHNYSNLLDDIVKVSHRPSWAAIFLMLFLQFFILLSFFASLPRSTSVKGFKTNKAERQGRVGKGEIGSWDPSSHKGDPEESL